MKKTYTININGIVFNIDDDAFDKLQKYLHDINSRFENAEEGKEIISDIEARIAEIFNTKINNSKQVVTLSDVDDVISIMGSPSEFGTEPDNQKEQNSEKSEEKEKSWRNKRVYRDTDNRIIGGVCSGIGSYFNIDPVIVRIIMVLTFFAFGPLLYIILWIAIPAARTTAQKLEMKGEKVNISNIEKSLREEFEEVKQNFKKMKNSEFKNGGNFFEKIAHIGAVVFSSVFKILGFIVGIFLLVIGLSLLIALLSTLIFGISDVAIGEESIPVSLFLNYFTDYSQPVLMFCSLMLLVFIPVLAVVYAGIKLIFKIKARNRIVGAAFSIIWVASLISLIVFGALTARDYKMQGEKISTTILCDSANTALNITPLIVKSTEDEKELNIGHGNRHQFSLKNGAITAFGEPTINIIKSDTSCFVVSIIKTSRGISSRTASENASNISYEIKMPSKTDSLKTLALGNYFTLNSDAKWRDPEVEVIVKVPVGKSIFIGNELQNFNINAFGPDISESGELYGKKWIMKSEGLEKLK